LSPLKIPLRRRFLGADQRHLNVRTKLCIWCTLLTTRVYYTSSQLAPA